MSERSARFGRGLRNRTLEDEEKERARGVDFIDSDRRMRMTEAERENAILKGDIPDRSKESKLKNFRSFMESDGGDIVKQGRGKAKRLGKDKLRISELSEEPLDSPLKTLKGSRIPRTSQTDQGVDFENELFMSSVSESGQAGEMDFEVEGETKRFSFERARLGFMGFVNHNTLFTVGEGNKKEFVYIKPKNNFNFLSRKNNFDNFNFFGNPKKKKNKKNNIFDVGFDF